MSVKKQTTAQRAKTSRFITAIIEDCNKSEQDVLIEEATIFIEDSIVECETQISLIQTSLLPSLNNKLMRANSALGKAQIAFEKSRYKTSSSFASYVDNRSTAEHSVDIAEQNIAVINCEIDDANEQLEKYEEILKDLKS
jgi:hypothetical protein